MSRHQEVSSVINRVSPVALLRECRERMRAIFGWQWFRGNYSTWDEALRTTTGYSCEEIPRRVLRSTREVIAGRAAFERDSVLFAVPQPDAPLLAALSRVSEALAGHLRVLDFGGALGSTYWRHRVWLESVPDLCWDVVEQPAFVEVGRSELGAHPVRFFSSVEEACRIEQYDVLLASGVLQYLEDPDLMIQDWVGRGFRWLLINNLPLHDGASTITVQHVPPSIYPASYPVWFFNREKFLERFSGRYEVDREFASEAVWPMRWRRFASTGLLLRRIS